MEPASASGLAALKHQFESGDIDPSCKTFVVVLTGHGLKEPDITIDMASKPLSIPAVVDELDSYLAEAGALKVRYLVNIR